jgi:hypothetical protein
LIDTPGFDDSERTDVEILEGIATWLDRTYAAGMLLTGVVLLQPITTNRYMGSEARRTRLFKKICGPNAYANVVIGTTMWNQLADQGSGHNRVDERKRSTEYWGDMIKVGARVVDHEDNKGSAHNIIRMLLKKRKTTLQMQEELAENDGYVFSTSAAQQLYDDLGVKSDEKGLELRELQREGAQYRKEIAELRQKIAMIENQRSQLETKVSTVSIEHLLELR